MIKALRPLDALFVIYHLLLAALVLAGASSIRPWLQFAVYDVILAAFIVYASNRAEKLPEPPGSGGRLFLSMRLWYFVPAIWVTYKQMYFLVPALRPELRDDVLIAADRLIFHGDMTTTLAGMASPLLTEILQIAYGSFYLLPFVLGLEVLLRKMTRELDFSAFSLILGFFIAYLGYFIFPAIGPRFTLHNFYTINTELPGMFFTNGIRELIDLGAGASSTDPQAARLIQRDVFPSAHTQITLIVMFLSLRLKISSRFFLVPAGILLILSTVYLRYHYLVDIAGGVIFCCITMILARPLYNAWQSFRGKEAFSYSKL